MIIHNSIKGYYIEFSKTDNVKIAKIAAALGVPLRTVVECIVINGLTVTDFDSVKGVLK